MIREPAASTEPGAPTPGAAETERELDQLRRAERIVLALRWLAVLSWPFLFQATRIPWRPGVVWPVYGAVLLYVAATHLLIRHSGAAIRPLAIATTVGDSVSIALMCWATGGIYSDVYFVFHLGVLATSLRFGMKETFAVLLLNGAFSVALFASAPGPLADLGIRLFYLAFVGLMGGLLSREVRRHYGRAVREAVENARLVEEVRAARDLQRDLLWQTIHAGEEERRRLAGEIHDRVGAQLFELYYAIRRSRDRAAAAEPGLGRELEALEERARACSQVLRGVMNELRPSVLDDLGFVEALREYVSSLQGLGELAVRLRVDPAVRVVSSEVGTMLFRVLQEAVLNVRKHAAARSLEVELRRDDGAVALSIRDDGRGFDPRAPVPGHWGLLYMRERAEACGGELRVDSRPGGGTEVRVVVPAGNGPAAPP